MSSRFRWLNSRRARVALAVVFCLCATMVLAALMAASLMTLVQTADRIDDTRSVHAAEAAEKVLLKQIAGTVRDNAFWDDAYENINRGRLAWAIDNWGETSKDYPLYDTVIVVAPDGDSFMMFHNGSAVVEGPRHFFDKSFEGLLRKARAMKKDDPIAASFVKSREGIAYLAAAPIQTSDGKAMGASYVLVFAKHIGRESLAEISDNAGLKDVRLTAELADGRQGIGLQNTDGKSIAVLNWIAEQPGTNSFYSITPLVILAAAGFVLFFATILALGFRVIWALKRDEAISRHRARHDALTGLLNRAGLSDAFATASENGNELCLHLVDLDGFKSVNDLWGHPVGDALIVAVAERVRHLVSDRAFVARLGGDEFAIVEPCVDSHDWKTTGNRIQAELAKPFRLSGRTVEVGCSVGQAIQAVGDDIFELLRKADIALYRAKEGGRGTTVCFQQGFDTEQMLQAALEQDLKAALEAQAIAVVFQPLVDTRTRRLRGVEALARWTAPGGPISPEVFIPLAERAGLIEELGLQVLRKALLGALEWPGLGLSVNASPMQLRTPHFPGQVKALLEDTRFDPRRLTIEITEGVLISNPEQAQRAISGLKALGVKIALDDFGTGYASIGTLRKFRFDRLKIDRSLIIAMDEDTEGAKVLQATIALAEALGIPVTAEGIETEEQAAALNRNGCDQLQGYLFSKPVPAEAIAHQIRAVKRVS